MIQHKVFSVPSGLVKVSHDVCHALDELEKTTRSSPGEKSALEALKRAKKALFTERHNVRHMMNYNKLLQIKVRELEQVVREQTAVCRVMRTKSCNPKVVNSEMKMVFRKAVMMLQTDKVTQRMSLTEVKDANERALASYNASKPDHDIDNILNELPLPSDDGDTSDDGDSTTLPQVSLKSSKKRKSNGRMKNTTTVEVSVVIPREVSVVIPYRKSRRLANKETENK